MSTRKDLNSMQKNFEVVSSLVTDLKSERNSLQYKLDLLTQEGHANNASLNLQRELLHQDRLAFTLERIAFDNQSKAASATAKATEANKTGQKSTEVEAAPCCNKSLLIKKAMSYSKKHTLSKPLTRLTAEGQIRTSLNIPHDEVKEIENNLTCNEENKKNFILNREIPFGISSQLMKKVTSDSENHAEMTPLEPLPNNDKTHISLYDELKEIDDNPFRDEENEEDSIISHEEQGSIPVGAASHFVKKAFYIPSLKFNNLTKKDSVEQSEAFD